MESIRILQDTYEKLYVLSAPVVKFLEDHLPAISPQWKTVCVDDVIESDCKRQNEKNLFDLDIYYLLKIILNQNNWYSLKGLYPEKNYFFNKQTYNLLKSVQDIRNKISHPTLTRYTVENYESWSHAIENLAKLFNCSIPNLLAELHESEKKKILIIIEEKVIVPALKCEALQQEIKNSVEDTKKRLQNQNTALGIIAFFSDALASNRGKIICDALHENKLLAFEDIKNDIFKIYYGNSI
ncbi:MAG: hypothetical protein ACRC5H_08745 [Treponemataceae bacterium]